MQAANLQHKRHLEAILLENAVPKKARSKTEAHAEIDKVERDRAQGVLSHGGQLKEWSKQVIRLQDCLKSLNKEEDHSVSIKNDFELRKISPILPGHLALEHSADERYLEVLSVTRKAQGNERLWKYRTDVRQDAFDNLGDRRKVWDAEVKRALIEVEGAVGKRTLKLLRTSVWTWPIADEFLGKERILVSFLSFFREIDDWSELITCAGHLRLVFVANIDFGSIDDVGRSLARSAFCAPFT